MNNHMPGKVCDEITYPFQTSTVQPLKFGMSNFIPHIIMYVIIYP